MKKYLCMSYKWRLIIDLFKPKIGWETREKIEEEIIILREKIVSKEEITNKEFEDTECGKKSWVNGQDI